MRVERGRLLITGPALALAIVILLFPPWRARAIRTTTRYAALPNVAPATVIDTVAWTIRALPLFAPPKPPVSALEGRELVRRVQSGDRAAKSRLLDLMDPFERRVGTPEILRTAGELWRDSVLSAAGIPSVSSYEVHFAVDDLGIVFRIAAIALLAFILDRRRVAASSRYDGGGGHNRQSTRA